MVSLVSVNTGLPREVLWHRKTVTTGIYKTPVEGRVTMRRLNLDGDGQADLTIHGGEFKAVYCYPAEHYDWWRTQLGHDLEAAMFGENLTTRGLDERDVQIGDRFSIGSAMVVVTQPRMPCYKLGIRFGSDQMVKRFLASGRSGFYVAVLREGDVGAGDAITRIERHPHGVPVCDIVRLYTAKRYTASDVSLVQQALQVPSLPDSWKEHFSARLDEARS
jgi:MOSC domain-containing protein YiiM